MITLKTIGPAVLLNGAYLVNKGNLYANVNGDKVTVCVKGLSHLDATGTFEDFEVNEVVPTSTDDLITKLANEVFYKGGGSGGGAVNSVTGDLVTGTASDPVIDLPLWVGLLRSDRVGYINSTDGMTLMLSRVVDAVKFLSPTPLPVLNLTYPTFPDDIKKITLIFNCDVDLINNTPVTDAILRNIPTRAKQYDCWTLIYDKGDRTWDLVSINSTPKWYVDEQLALKSNVAAAALSSPALTFTADNVSGTIAAPITANITGDVTGAKLGATALVIHNGSAAPTFDAKFKKLKDSGDYVADQLNLIYCQYLDDNTIVYFINQVV